VRCRVHIPAPLVSFQSVALTIVVGIDQTLGTAATDNNPKKKKKNRSPRGPTAAQRRRVSFSLRLHLLSGTAHITKIRHELYSFSPASTSRSLGIRENAPV